MSFPATPLINAKYLDINGMALFWTSATEFGCTDGTCRDSSNVNDITIETAAGSINLLSTVSGAGGLDTGTIADSTLYYIYAIGDSLATNSGNIVISLSFDAPVLPYGFDMYRRIGAVLTDASADFLEFYQTSNLNTNIRRMWYDAGISVLAAGASATFAAVSLAAFMPSFQTSVLLNADLTPTGNGNTATIQPTGATSATGYIVIGGSQAGVAMNLPIEVPCNSSASIDYKVTGTLTLLLRAYDDNL